MKYCIYASICLFSTLYAAEIAKPTPPNPACDELWNALATQDLAAAQKLIDKNHALANCVQAWNGNPFLVASAERSDLPATKFLLAAGARPNLADSKGVTPLMAAAENGNQDLAELLLIYGANIDAQDEQGATALVYAVAHNHTALVEFLVAAGANIDIRSGKHKLPLLAFGDQPSKTKKETIERGLRKGTLRRKLWEFMEKNNTDGIRKLIPELSASLLNLPQNNNTPLMWAVANGHADIVQKLIKAGAQVNQYRLNKTTPLILAAAYDRNKIAQMLISAHADVNARDADGVTPLIWTALNDNIELEKMLKAAGADLNSATTHGSTALATAIELKHPEIALLLLEQGANPNTEDSEGYTPLLQAIARKQGQLVAQLAEHGADINAKNQFGITPLMAAAQVNASEITKFLTLRGADTTARDIEGLSIADYAQNAELKASVERAIEQGKQAQPKKALYDKQGFKRVNKLASIDEEKLEEEEKQSAK